MKDEFKYKVRVQVLRFNENCLQEETGKTDLKWLKNTLVWS